MGIAKHFSNHQSRENASNTFNAFGRNQTEGNLLLGNNQGKQGMELRTQTSSEVRRRDNRQMMKHAFTVNRIEFTKDPNIGK
jgi:hypothetical protein